MNEEKWVKKIAALINKALKPPFKAEVGLHIPYANEMRRVGKRVFKSDDEEVANRQILPTSRWFQTDIAIVEWHNKAEFTPRVVVEAKWTTTRNNPTTQDAIIYNRKVAQHKSIFPYLRYGFAIGHNGNAPNVPARVCRHGWNFDFLCCVKDGAKKEEDDFVALLVKEEIAASETMEKVIYREERRKTIHRKLAAR